MRNDWYPDGTIKNLLKTDSVSPQTKAVLQQRLNTPVVTKPSFFSEEEFTTLQALCKRLLPQPLDRIEPIDLPGILDANFKEGKNGNGWRYDVLPPDEEAYRKGLRAIEQSAQTRYGKAFGDLKTKEQDEIINAIQAGTIEDNDWEMLSPFHFFKDLMASLTEIYYSHPLGRDEIGDASVADSSGWHRVGLNEREDREPENVNQSKG